MRISRKIAVGSMLILACAFNARWWSAGARPVAAAPVPEHAPRRNQSQRQEAVNGARISPAPLLEGEWEGEVLFPSRPSVFLADLEKGQGFLSTHGATPFRLTQRRLDDGKLLLELHLGHEVVRFSAIDDESRMRGTRRQWR